MAAKVTLNHAGMQALLNSAGIRADMLRRAHAAATVAQATAPVESGEYRAGIHAESATTDRAVGRVVATAPHSAVVEAKTRNLGRAIDAAGA